MPDTDDLRRVGDLGSWQGGSTPAMRVQTFWGGSIPWVSPKDMSDSITTTEKQLTTSGAARLTTYKKGDIAVVFRSGILRHSFPVARLTVPSSVNQDIKVLQPAEDLDCGYTFHLLKGLEHRVVTSAVKIGTTVESVDPHAFFNLQVFVPYEAEQRLIAWILDTVDEAIRKTEQLIAKLKLVKKGLLHDLLTRGIDDNGELRDPDRHPEQFKDSPLGRIPREWSLTPLGELASVSGGVTLGRDLSGPSVLELPYLRVANVQDGYLDLSEVKQVRILASEEERYRLKSGDVLMNEGGDFDKLGRGTVWEGQIPRCLHQNHVFRVRSESNDLDPWFLAGVSESHVGKSYFVRASKQTTNLATINSRQIKSFLVPLPAREEQDCIVEVLQRAGERWDRERSLLDKLCLLKAGLMADLLTGRVRVTPLLETSTG